MVWRYPWSHRMFIRLFKLFFFNDTATSEIYTLSLHDALPICYRSLLSSFTDGQGGIRTHGTLAGTPVFETGRFNRSRSEEHTSELQSQSNLVCRLLLEKKNYAKVAIN